MPILDVELVCGPRDAPPPEGLARRVADAVAKVLDLPPGRVWVRLRELSAERYAENGISEPPRPAFVHVLRRELPPPERLADEVRALTDALAPLLERPPDLVHLEHAPPGAGRVAFGGRLTE